jgi:hypothetical protein
MTNKPTQTPAGGDASPRPLFWSLTFGGAGVVVAVVGMWLVARGEITLAPLLLVLAYLVLFPLALTR